MKRCLIYLDPKESHNSIDLLEVARQMFSHEPYETYGVVINNDAELAIGTFDKCILMDHPDIKPYDQVAVAGVIIELHDHYNFDAILVPATYFGRMLAPRIAMLIGAGLVADVTSISRYKNELEMIRPAYSGRMMAGIVSKSQGPIMMSIRQDVFRYTGNFDHKTELIHYKPSQPKDGGIHYVSAKKKEQLYDIRESQVLISGGGGVGKNFHQLEKLATILDGQVSASRSIVDQGIAPRSIQVGQSGKTVSPKLYIALGINGAIQHIEGLKQVDHIISVNTNKDAPICSLSDMVVVGDAATFVHKLVEKIEQT